MPASPLTNFPPSVRSRRTQLPPPQHQVEVQEDLEEQEEPLEIDQEDENSDSHNLQRIEELEQLLVLSRQQAHELSVARTELESEVDRLRTEATHAMLGQADFPPSELRTARTQLEAQASQLRQSINQQVDLMRVSYSTLLAERAAQEAEISQLKGRLSGGLGHLGRAEPEPSNRVAELTQENEELQRQLQVLATALAERPDASEVHELQVALTNLQKETAGIQRGGLRHKESEILKLEEERNELQRRTTETIQSRYQDSQRQLQALLLEKSELHAKLAVLETSQAEAESSNFELSTLRAEVSGLQTHNNRLEREVNELRQLNEKQEHTIQRLAKQGDQDKTELEDTLAENETRQRHHASELAELEKENAALGSQSIEIQRQLNESREDQVRLRVLFEQAEDRAAAGDRENSELRLMNEEVSRALEELKEHHKGLQLLHEQLENRSEANDEEAQAVREELAAVQQELGSVKDQVGELTAQHGQQMALAKEQLNEAHEQTTRLLEEAQLQTGGLAAENAQLRQMIERGRRESPGLQHLQTENNRLLSENRDLSDRLERTQLQVRRATELNTESTNSTTLASQPEAADHSDCLHQKQELEQQIWRLTSQLQASQHELGAEKSRREQAEEEARSVSAAAAAATAETQTDDFELVLEGQAKLTEAIKSIKELERTRNNLEYEVERLGAEKTDLERRLSSTETKLQQASQRTLEAEERRGNLSLSDRDFVCPLTLPESEHAALLQARNEILELEGRLHRAEDETRLQLEQLEKEKQFSEKLKTDLASTRTELRTREDSLKDMTRKLAENDHTLLLDELQKRDKSQATELHSLRSKAHSLEASVHQEQHERTLAKLKLEQLERELTMAQSSRDRISEELRASVRARQQEAITHQEQQTELQDELQDLREAVTDKDSLLRDKADALADSMARLETARQTAASLKTDLQAAQEEVRRLGDVSNNASNTAETSLDLVAESRLEMQVSSLKNRIQLLQVELSQKEGEMTSAQEAANRSLAQIAGLRKDLDAMKAQLRKSAADLRQREQEIGSLQQRLEEELSKPDLTPELAAEREKLSRDNAKLRQQLAEAQAQTPRIERLQAQLERLKTEKLEAVQELYDKLQEVTKAHAEWKRESLAKARELMDASSNQSDEVENYKAQVEQFNSLLADSTRDVDAANAAVEKGREANRQLKDELSALQVRLFFGWFDSLISLSPSDFP